MLTIKNKLLLWKFNRLVKKRNKAFFKGDYGNAEYYGKLVDQYIMQVLDIEGAL